MTRMTALVPQPPTLPYRDHPHADSPCGCCGRPFGSHQQGQCTAAFLEVGEAISRRRPSYAVSVRRRLIARASEAVAS